MGLKYNMRNLRPGFPRDLGGVFYILDRLDEKEVQLGGVEDAVLTFELHHSGGPKFGTRAKSEAESMVKKGIAGPQVVKYWTRDEILSIAAKYFKTFREGIYTATA